MGIIDSTIAQSLFHMHRGDRAGINKKPEMASVCLICGSVHMDADPGDNRRLVCRNCGFAFYRYPCPSCGCAIDSRDPTNLRCPDCRERRCICGSCECLKKPSD
jgi:hypothetical protein